MMPPTQRFISARPDTNAGELRRHVENKAEGIKNETK